MQVGDIARAFGGALRDTGVLSPDQHAVLSAIERCRTAVLGGHKCCVLDVEIERVTHRRVVLGSVGPS